MRKLLLLAAASSVVFGCVKLNPESKPNINQNKNNDQKEYFDQEVARQQTLKFNSELVSLGEAHNVVADLPVFETSPDSLVATANNAMAEADASLSEIASTVNVSFENTVKKIDEIFYNIDQASYRIGFIAETTPDASLKAKARELEVIIEAWYVDANARADVYQVVKKYADSKPVLNGEDAELLKDVMLGFERAGFNLPTETQDAANVLRKELSELTSKMGENISKSNSNKVVFSAAEVASLPASAIEALDLDESTKTYSLNAGVRNQTRAVIENSTNEAVRKKAFVGMVSRAKLANKELGEQVVRKRAQLAKLLGYATWADFQIAPRMAGNAQTAIEFTKDLSSGLEPKFQAELEKFRLLKVAETGDANAIIQAWDVNHFIKVMKKKEFELDLDGLKKYFEYENTLQGMFSLFEDIFGLSIVEVEAPYKWHEDVRLIRIDDKSGRPLGHVYLDMFPRPESGKYGHFAMFTLRSGKLIEGGLSRRPVAALVCNFPRATAGKPSLLSLDHVETLFHEFGHALHGILSETKYARFAGTKVPRDFVEAPSQMLEYWVNDKATLDRFARNYQDENDRIPENVLSKIEAANLSSVASAYRRQLSFGIMDLKLHTEVAEDENFDLINLTNSVLSEIYLPYPEGTSFITAFGHLWGGYDAGYYGYAWSDSAAADMASVFEAAAGGFGDRELGMRLRKEVYERGASRPVAESIRAFLQREPSNAAFLKKLGLGN